MLVALISLIFPLIDVARIERRDSNGDEESDISN